MEITPLTQKQHEQKIIEAMYVYLAQIEQTAENPNTIQHISEDLDYISVKYFQQSPDGDRQEEYANEAVKTIDFKDALHILTTRLNNSL